MSKKSNKRIPRQDSLSDPLLPKSGDEVSDVQNKDQNDSSVYDHPIQHTLPSQAEGYSINQSLPTPSNSPKKQKQEQHGSSNNTIGVTLPDDITSPFIQTLRKEEAISAQIIAKREEYIARIKSISLWSIITIHILLLLHYFITHIGLFISYSFARSFQQIHDEFTQLFLHYFDSVTYRTNISDIILVMAIRLVVSLVDLALLTTDERRNFTCSSIHYWSNFALIFVSIAKMIVLNWKAAPASAIMFIIPVVCVNIYLYILSHLMRPLDVDVWDNPDPSEQAEIDKRKKMHQEACERADHLTTQLSGEELQQHLETERRRVESYELVEALAARARLAKKQAEDVDFFEFMAFIRPYFWPDGFSHKLIVFTTWIVLGLHKASSIAAPLFIGYAVDQVVNDNTIPWRHFGIYCALTFLSTAFRQTQSAIYLKVKQQAYVQIASLTFGHLLRLSLRWHNSKKLGQVIRSLDRGIAAADNVVTYLFLLLVPSIGECIVVFIIFFTKFQQPLLTVIVFISLVLYATATIQMTIWRKPYRKKARQYDNIYHDIAVDVLTNIDTVKAFANEDYEVNRYMSAVRTFQSYAITTQLSLSLVNSTQTFIIQACLLLCLFVTGKQVVDGGMSIGAISSIAAYVVSLFAPLNFLGSVYDLLVQALIDLSAVFELQRIPNDVPDYENAVDLVLPKHQAPLIAFNNVVFSYDGEKRGLDGVSFVCKPGTTTAIVGSTGAGKSTIAKLLLRFYDPTSGSITINGQDIKYVKQNSLRKNISFVPQECILFNDTILNNIAYGNLDATLEEIEKASEAAHILEFIRKLPRQFDTMVGEKGFKLSGGERQRVNIARSLLKSFAKGGSYSGIVLSDEMTSAVDIITERSIQDSLRKLEQGTTTIIIAHRLSTIQHADNIIVMDKGRVLEQGSHHELMENPNGRYYTMWMQQFLDQEDNSPRHTPSSSGIPTITNGNVSSSSSTDPTPTSSSSSPTPPPSSSITTK